MAVRSATRLSLTPAVAMSAKLGTTRSSRESMRRRARGRPVRGRRVGVTGPEFRSQGFVPVGLGPRILRVETAAIVAIALVQAAAGGLD